MAYNFILKNLSKPEDEDKFKSIYIKGDDGYLWKSFTIDINDDLKNDFLNVHTDAFYFCIYGSVDEYDVFLFNKDKKLIAGCTIDEYCIFDIETYE